MLITSLRNFCIKENYFTCGTNEQYDKLFNLALETPAPRDLAIMIYICSDHDTIEEIDHKIRIALGRYL